ncbi:pseudaminic acid cytidylyltransferase [Rheinheimera sp.]|uniref:pseudaminic acid cytidylyltransferase n=1 Tax=Rheinheimera sp. TaxID=1869214 RepID=UPI00307E9610
MKLAIIPARGGSKRIPGKNIRAFCGKPMIAWSIEAARASNLFDRIIVSTDSSEIARVAKTYGAEVPFIRPAELADDYATTRVVVNHAIQWAQTEQLNPVYVCCIYPTAPFVTAALLNESFKTLINSQKEFCFPVTSYPYPIQRALFMDSNGGVNMFQPEHRTSRSQDLVPAYHDAGQFYWGKTDAFLENKAMFSALATAIVLPRSQVEDIDTEEDWTVAEQLFKRLNP